MCNNIWLEIVVWIGWSRSLLRFSIPSQLLLSVTATTTHLVWVMHYTPTLGAIKVKCGTQWSGQKMWLPRFGSCMYTRVRWVVEFLSRGYKISFIFSKNEFSKENWCLLWIDIALNLKKLSIILEDKVVPPNLKLSI